MSLNVNPKSYGRYQVLELLGEGAMGRVFLSEDPILKRKVAVKIIPTDRQLAPVVLEEYLGRFALEAQSCARLNHQSIVSIYDAGNENGTPWIAFEYVKGEHLDALLAGKKQLPPNQTIAVASDIAQALHHAHSMNIVHRDIKPANILIDENTKIAKLADFGVVKSPLTSITQSGISVGSPGYMSPEQIDGTDIDGRSDLFSFGIVLYEMLTGAHPFLRDTVQATFFATVKCNYKPVRELNEKASDKLVHIVEKCLVADKNKRIKNAEELCTLIAGCVEDKSRKTKLQSIKTTESPLTGKIENAYALTQQKVKKGLASAVPLYKRTYHNILRFFNDKVLPALSSTFHKFYDPLESRYSKSQIITAAAAALGVTAIAVTTLLIVTVRDKNDDMRRVQKAARSLGYTVTNNNALIDSCRAQIIRGDLDRANDLADILILSKRNEVQGRLLKAMAAMVSGRYGEAHEWLMELQKISGGANAIRREHPFFVNYIEKRIDREMPVAVVNMCAEGLFLNETPEIRVWVKSDHYWQRWNAARILKKAGHRVDLVELYILDLEHSASSNTKIRAAERLGEIGDRRAIPALIDARDGRGPASLAARKSLRENFNVR
ncbi:MAG: protein kinase [Chitinispirillia bacterium]|nr:protein kinase [Chitinispirillia bacterium]